MKNDILEKARDLGTQRTLDSTILFRRRKYKMEWGTSYHRCPIKNGKKTPE